MARSCGIGCCKLFLVVLNLLFMLCGGAILGLGIWMMVSEGGAFVEILHDASCDECSKAMEYLKIPYVLMGIGGFVTLLSFLGCCGAWTESSCFLCLYSMFLLVILLAEVACAIMIAIFKNKITKCLECSMHQQVKLLYNQTDIPNLPASYKNNKTDVLTAAWDKMQRDLQCCGASSPSDYRLSNWFNHTVGKTNMPVPPTCCASTKKNPDVPVRDTKSCRSEAILYNNKQNGDSPPETNYLHTEGCHDAFLGWLKHNLYISIAVLTAIILLQIVDFIAACLLLSRIRGEQLKRPYYQVDASDNKATF